MGAARRGRPGKRRRETEVAIGFIRFHRGIARTAYTECRTGIRASGNQRGSEKDCARPESQLPRCALRIARLDSYAERGSGATSVSHAVHRVCEVVRDDRNFARSAFGRFRAKPERPIRPRPNCFFGTVSRFEAEKAICHRAYEEHLVDSVTRLKE